ncbi:Panacea domain-containing protein [Aquirufa nivalisilvae]
MKQVEENTEEIVHSLLYILNKLGKPTGFHKIFKILYFANQKHLIKFGAPIHYEKYIKMDNGPVPSIAYDIFNSLKDKGALVSQKDYFSSYFKLSDNHYVNALIAADLDFLSEFEISMLDESIEENKELSFLKLKAKSHDFAWENTQSNGEINKLNIAKAAGASEEMVRYLSSHLENTYAKFE